MASARGTKVAEAFSNKLLLEMYDMSLVGGNAIVNREYEGEINGVGSKINILNIARISEKDYSGANLSVDSIYENNCVLEITAKKSFYWAEKTIDNWVSFVKDPHSTVVKQKASERVKNIDTFILGFYGDVAAGNRVGTDYTTGTVTVANTTGAVTGSGTTFTSAMVGRGFKALGHTKWYRVKTYSSTTSIVIEDDLDDATSAYTGGAINAGATYIIEAATPISITTTNLLSEIALMRQKLDKAESNGYNSVPSEDRWLIVPPEFMNTLVRAQGVALHVPEVYSTLVGKGFQGMLLGFKLFVSNRLTGDNTNGYRVLAGHPNWITFAEKMLEVGMEDLIGNFGKAFKDLFVYGAKVPDSRRGFASELYCTFA